MKNKVIFPMMAGLFALALIVISAFVPWFRWSFQEDSQARYERTDVWGPPAYVVGLTDYTSVDTSADGIRAVNWAAGGYLGLFLVGVVSWMVLIWLLGQEVERRIVFFAAGAASVLVSGGLVVVLGLGELIAQRVGLYAATRTSQIVVADLVGMQVFGPLLLLVGVAIEVGMVVWKLQRNRRGRDDG